MRRRSLVTVTSLVFLLGLAGSFALSQHVGHLGAARSSSAPSAVHRVLRHDVVRVAVPSDATSARVVLSSAIIAATPAVAFSALWLALGAIFLLPAASVVRPTCHRRAPPRLVI